jgi:acyl-coenzyme A synthetase/AMP-(fatty) acid ligase
MNAYGPTETTVSVTHCRFDPEADDLEAAPIATAPIACAGLYLLRADLSPCQPGEEGDIFISGHTVSNGYWGNPADTAASFVPDPFTHDGLMYRTGDKGVCRHGRLYFTGRHDDQVKINGYRVELEDITTCLRQCPGVTNAVVLLDASGPRALLRGFVTMAGDQSPDVERLKRFLGDRLPRFMVPASFHRVDQIPLTINGKVDRQALLAQAGSSATPVDADSGGMDVGDIWSKHLAIPRDRLGLDSDFFDLGGNSILLIEVLRDIDHMLCAGRSGPSLLAGLKTFLVKPRLAQMVRLVESVHPRTPQPNG